MKITKQDLDYEMKKINVEITFRGMFEGRLSPYSVGLGTSQLFWSRVRKYLGIKWWQFWRDPVVEALEILEI